jgi:hypothetical protein
MEVKMKYSNREVYFQGIERGEVFVYEDEAYLRLDRTYELDGNDNDANAIHLETGELCYFCDCNQVIRPTKVFPMEIVY